MANDWLKFDLHLHTADDPKDQLAHSAEQILDRATALGFGALAITLHDAVFDRPEVFAEAQRRGLLLIPATEKRLCGGDVVLLNVTQAEADSLHDFDDLRALRKRRGDSLFVFAPHPFYQLGHSLGRRLIKEIDCFDAIEWCHFYKGWLFNLNRPAARVAERFGKPLLATSDAHRLSAFGSHYTSMPRPAELTIESFFAGLRESTIRLTSPPCTWPQLVRALWMVVSSRFQKRKTRTAARLPASPSFSRLKPQPNNGRPASGEVA